MTDHRQPSHHCGWWRDYFHDHPDGHLAPRHPEAWISDKMKVYCKACLFQHIAAEWACDEEDVRKGRRSACRTEQAIEESLWTISWQNDKTRGYLNSCQDTLLHHLSICLNQPQAVQDRVSSQKVSNRQGASSPQRMQSLKQKFEESAAVTDVSMPSVPGASQPVYMVPASVYPAIGEPGPSRAPLLFSPLSRAPTTLSPISSYPPTAAQTPLSFLHSLAPSPSPAPSVKQFLFLIITTVIIYS
ncbi:hypothetical protein AcV5_008727 [Taiwanofungus camphoratus]|nr:hypothetical protein AcV5_008727 [Antrodia cinnamomea]